MSVLLSATSATEPASSPSSRATRRRSGGCCLRDVGTIRPATLPPITPQDQIFEEFSDYLRSERGLAPKSIIRHLPFIRRFLRELCPADASDLCKISQEDVTRYIERHARDWSAASGKAMCWSLRAFLRYLHHRRLNPLALARQTNPLPAERSSARVPYGKKPHYAEWNLGDVRSTGRNFGQTIGRIQNRSA